MRSIFLAVATLCVPAVCLSQRQSDSAQIAWVDQMQRAVDSTAELPGARVTRAALREDSTFYRLRGKDDWPESTAASFGVFEDRGKVRMAWESPMSLSGDWALTTVHWFDDAGMARLVEVSYGRITFCLDKDDEPISGAEVTRIYRAADGRELGRRVRRTGGRDGTTDLSALTNCVNTGDVEYVVYPNWKAMSQATGLARVLQSR